MATIQTTLDSSFAIAGANTGDNNNDDDVYTDATESPPDWAMEVDRLKDKYEEKMSKKRKHSADFRETRR